MKKISLKDLNMRLSRSQMKTITGGTRSVQGIEDNTGTCSGDCNVTLDGVLKKGTCTVAQQYCYCSSGLGVCK